MLDQRGMDQIGQRARLAAPARRRRQVVLGQAPAGVEGQAEAAHRAAVQQRLEAHLRADDIDRAADLEQRRRMHIAGDQRDPRRGGRAQRLEMAAPPPGDHVRMHLQPDRRVRMLVERGLEQAREAGRVGAAAGDRGVAGGLVDHQHRRLRRLVAQRAGQAVAHGVVLRHPRLDPLLLQRQRPRDRRAVARLQDLLLQPRGPVRVVVDAAEIVDHDGQRRAAAAQLDRAQEAVLDADQRQAVARGEGLGHLGAGAVAPGHDRGDVGGRAPVDQAPFRQHRRQRRHAAQAGRQACQAGARVVGALRRPQAIGEGHGPLVSSAESGTVRGAGAGALQPGS